MPRFFKAIMLLNAIYTIHAAPEPLWENTPEGYATWFARLACWLIAAAFAYGAVTEGKE